MLAQGNMNMYGYVITNLLNLREFFHVLCILIISVHAFMQTLYHTVMYM